MARGSGFSGHLSPRRGHNGDWVCGVPSAACVGAECFVSAAVLRVPRTLWASQGGMAACLTSAVCVYAVGVCGWQREGPGRRRS